MSDLKALEITPEQNDQATAVQEELLDLVARAKAAGFSWPCIIAGIGAGISQAFVDLSGDTAAGFGLAAHWHSTARSINLGELRASASGGAPRKVN